MFFHSKKHFSRLLSSSLVSVNHKKILQLPEAGKVNGYTFMRSNFTIFFFESLASDAVSVLFANFSYTMNCQTDPRAMLEYFVHEFCHSKHSKTLGCCPCLRLLHLSTAYGPQNGKHQLFVQKSPTNKLVCNFP